MNAPVLDLTNRAFTHVLGEITIIGTWYGADINECEPVLCLVPTHRLNLFDGVSIRSKPCCVALSAAYLYDEPRYLLARAREFSELLGFGDDMQRTHRIAEAIHGRLQDLIQMPPRPVIGSFVGADATLTDQDTGRQTTHELHHHY
jgi:hypothetical protein